MPGLVSCTGFPDGGDDFLSSEPQVNALNVQGRGLRTNGGNLELAPVSPLDPDCALLLPLHSSVALYGEARTLTVDIDTSRGHCSRASAVRTRQGRLQQDFSVTRGTPRLQDETKRQPGEEHRRPPLRRGCRRWCGSPLFSICLWDLCGSLGLPHWLDALFSRLSVQVRI